LLRHCLERLERKRKKKEAEASAELSHTSLVNRHTTTSSAAVKTEGVIDPKHVADEINLPVCCPRPKPEIDQTKNWECKMCKRWNPNEQERCPDCFSYYLDMYRPADIPVPVGGPRPAYLNGPGHPPPPRPPVIPNPSVISTSSASSISTRSSSSLKKKSSKKSSPSSSMKAVVIPFGSETQCCICHDSYLSENKEGAICCEGHFVCWKECFLLYLNTAKAIDNEIDSYVDEEGQLTCPECKNGYNVLKIATNAPDESYGESLLELKLQYKIMEKVRIVREEEENHWKNEIEKMKDMTEFDREIYVLRNEIVNNILTPRCPSCLKAFLDFDGCFALTCSPNGCNAVFCAWCEELCAVDAHPHVASCKYGNGDVYGDISLIEPVRNYRRAEKIYTLMLDKSRMIKDKIKEIMKNDFNDLKLIVDF
jgi:RNA polymerase subunit RPABC4/transcription elongation factor Spt4